MGRAATYAAYPAPSGFNSSNTLHQGRIESADRLELPTFGDGILTEERLGELEAGAQRDGALPSAILKELFAEVREQREKYQVSEQLQGAYIEEIHRLNGLVRELIEYVESVAEIAQDGHEANDVSSDIKRRAMNLIITSVRSLREHEQERKNRF